MSGSATVQSLERAFTILENLSQKPEGMQLTELAEKTSLHKSTVHRLLASLINLGYVRQQQSGLYALTLRLFEISGRVVDSMDMPNAAKPSLEQLRDNTQETVHLVVREGIDIVYIYKAESRQSSFRMFSRIGMRRPMYCTAAGKSMLAQLPDSEIAEVWKASRIHAYTPHTIVTLDDLMEEISHIRSQGYAMDNEENELGVRCIAAALSTPSGMDGAAFSLSAPIVRIPLERIQTLSQEVLEAKHRIDSALGGTA